jgi:tetratricopeptide (TPR) repeat protein
VVHRYGQLVNMVAGIVALCVSATPGLAQLTDASGLSSEQSLIAPRAVSPATPDKLHPQPDGVKILPTESKPPLQPTGSMQMWFYPVSRDFRYPIPTDFDFAYIDKTGKIAIRGPFGCARSFSNKRAAVYVCELENVDGKWTAKIESPRYDRWAIIDTVGNPISPPKFRTIEPFYDTLASAEIDQQRSEKVSSFQKGVFVDTQGEVQPAPGSDGDAHYRSFSEGLAAGFDRPKDAQTIKERLAKYGTHEGYGYIDKNLNIVIPMQFAGAEEFSEGLAVVTRVGLGEQQRADSYAAFQAKGQPNQTQVMTEEQRKKAIKEQMAAYERMQEELKEPDNKAYIDKKGTVVIPGPFQQAKHFRNGFAAVKKKGAWGFIDPKGKTAIPFTYDYADDFGDGLALVEKNKMVGYIDSKNQVVIALQFADAQPFTDGMAAATLDGTHWGYIDKTGAFVIEPTFKRAFPFSDGLALVFAKSDKNWGTNKSEAPYFYFTARKSRTILQLATARAACDVAIRLDPSSIWAEKCARFKKIVLPSPEPSPSVLEEYDAARALRMTQPQDAEAKLKELIKDSPEFEWPYGELAAQLIEEKRFDEAEKYLNDILKKKPEYVRGYLWLSQVFLNRGDLGKAAELMAKARTLDSDDELLALLPPIPPLAAPSK